MMDVEYIQKDNANTHQNYKYASEKAIKTALGTAFRKHGVVLKLDTENPRIEMNMEPGKFSTLRATYIDTTYTFYDVDSGESLTGKMVSSGPARDDKGLWAATTNAIKYILTTTFLIPTGDDAESDTNHPATITEPPKQNKKPTPPPKPKAKSLKTLFWEALQAKADKEDLKPSDLTKPIIRKIIQDIGEAEGLNVSEEALNLIVKDKNNSIYPLITPQLKNYSVKRAIEDFKDIGKLGGVNEGK